MTDLLAAGYMAAMAKLYGGLSPSQEAAALGVWPNGLGSRRPNVLS